jgi:DNA-binding transcriptional LysR family regulator
MGCDVLQHIHRHRPRRHAVTPWPGVEARHLAALVAVAETRSFRGAAARVGCVQSAISERVLQLERIVGARLVVRTRGRSQVRLTIEGEVLVERARNVLAVRGAVAADLRTRRVGPQASLRVGGFERAAPVLLPGTARRFSGDRPELGLELCGPDDAEACAAEVANGAIDVAFSELPGPEGPFAFREVCADPYVLLVAAAGPLARRGRAPSGGELSTLPLVVDSAACLRWVQGSLRGAGVNATITCHDGDGPALGELVARGLGLAVQRRLTVPEDPRVAILPLDGMIAARRWALYWHDARRADEAVQAFVRAAVAEAEALGLAPTRMLRAWEGGRAA